MGGNGSLFPKDKIVEEMESLRLSNGAFIAAPTDDYRAMWIRDTLYATFAYWYLKEFDKLRQGIYIVLDLFGKHLESINLRVTSPCDIPEGLIHAKYSAESLEEIAPQWSNEQWDALGLFLHVVADLDFKNIPVIRDERDREIVQAIVNYLRSVEYWHNPDFGMWEECKIRHSSSIGAVVGGLSYVRRRRMAVVAGPLIRYGESALRAILPYESQDLCGRPHHNHHADSSQLSLIWPYNVVSRAEADQILGQILDGPTPLVQKRGLNRYWGDDYYRSTEGKHTGISAEWPMFKFWLSIVYSQRHEYETAAHWLREGCKEITQNKIPEAYQNGHPNQHTPLAWAHAIALIAFQKLPAEIQQQFS